MPTSRLSLCAVASSSALLFFAAPLSTSARPLNLAPTDPGLCRVPSTQALGVTLQIEPADNQLEFREGEVIALTAPYSTGSAGTYLLNTVEADPGALMANLEVVCVSPDADALGTSTFNSLARTYSDNVDLMESKQFTVDVNTWHRLKPGTYRVYVESRRVRLSNGAPPEAIEEPVLVSNAIQLRVVEASMPWQAAKLSEAEATLDAFLGSPQDDEQLRHMAEDAATALRYLCTEDATREMARRYGTSPWFESRFRDGLLTTPFRDAAIEAMNAAIADPNRTIDSQFISLLAQLEVQRDSKTTMGAGDLRRQTAQLLYDRSAEYKARVKELELARLSSLPAKVPEIRAETAIDILDYSDFPIDPTEKQALINALVSSWDSMDSPARRDVLGRHWVKVAGPEWLPIFRATLARHLDGDDDESSSMALFRMYEVAPDEARDRILREIAQPTGMIDIDTLAILPEHELPQLDAKLLAGYKSGSAHGLETQLIERYASAAIFPQLRVAYESSASSQDCLTQPLMLRYFLRVKPEYGIAQVRAAASPKTTGGACVDLFSVLGSDVSRPEIERLAIADLWSKNPAPLRNAANALSEYGSTLAEGALYARLEDFGKARAASMKRGDDDDVPFGIEPENATSTLEFSVLSALIGGTNWYFTTNDIRSLETTVTQGNAEYLNSAVQSESPDSIRFLSIHWSRAKLQWTMGWYRGATLESLKVKLAQLPPGTRIFLHAGAEETAAHKEVFSAIEDAAHSDGLDLDSFSGYSAQGE
jgi:hypothetical protein